jgi:hypothetical protein
MYLPILPKSLRRVEKGGRLQKKRFILEIY